MITTDRSGPSPSPPPSDAQRAGGAGAEAPVLHVEGLTLELRGRDRALTLVEDVGFSVLPGRTLSIVGESGSGKSLTALSLMRLLPGGIAIAGGSIRVEGEEITRLAPEAMRRLRGSRLAMIFQEPMTALNPAFTIGDQVVEAIRAHRSLGAAAARAEAVALLRQVHIPSPETRLDAYPHQLSGGMRQRVVIAMALANRPAVLIADEPTTALDVTVQAQILELLHELRQTMRAGVVLITHDLGVVRQVADDVVVLYAGRVMERGTAAEIFGDPQHPYTLGLLGALPSGRAERRLMVIPGIVPAPDRLPKGCRFSSRCVLATETCRQEVPPMRPFSPTHHVACWRAPIETIVPEGAR